MDDGIEIQLQGRDDAVEAFKLLKDYVVGNPFRQAARAGAQLVLNEIYTRIPVRTGTLVSNLRIITRKVRGAIGARIVINQSGKAGEKNNAFYWRFVEFGHRTRNEGGQGFVQPEPFVTPSFESQKEKAAQTVIDAFSDALSRAEARAQRAGVSV